jgi:hypothetical protein
MDGGGMATRRGSQGYEAQDGSRDSGEVLQHSQYLMEPEKLL